MSITIETPHDLLRAYGLETKKKFGQHFLSDPSILERIADAAKIASGDRVLEVGPGCGTLTWTMLRRGASVHAVEIDAQAAAFLRRVLLGSVHSNFAFTLTQEDALRVDFGALLQGHSSWKCVSNLPYNVGTEVFFRLTERASCFASMTLMFQREVAYRMVAPRGDSHYGVLSLMTQLHYDATIMMDLPPGAFRPPPKVHSALIHLVPVQGGRIRDDAVRHMFVRLVRATFQKRRKKILNGMKSLGYDKEVLEDVLFAAGVDPMLRPEQVDFDGFALLATHLCAARILAQ